jgi:hypothetical protein
MAPAQRIVDQGHAWKHAGQPQDACSKRQQHIAVLRLLNVNTSSAEG